MNFHYPPHPSFHNHSHHQVPPPPPQFPSSSTNVHQQHNNNNQQYPWSYTVSQEERGQTRNSFTLAALNEYFHIFFESK
uniref:Homeobox domain-containing protein n=1 Tax=Caenorhabditis tropicalis TaxID=1561998 RepID=A0A1I7UAM6_9PELO